ncbi:hypothetical protein FZEAL_10261 [Fusarium zealandicum]|uniref:Uncharacterized protein n=1 Tax=Fusarium zealandicum TaxID=1053134 RepID=A0A8H4U3N7_9HYPO|nr:hypothetical protein FZEAL_10261 [Fusarium zealandicum]
MSAQVVTSSLQTLVEKAEAIPPKLDKARPDSDQWHTLELLGQRLMEAASVIQQTIQTRKKSRYELAWKEAELLRSQSADAKKVLFAKPPTKMPTVFKRNIVNIFRPPKMSRLDGDVTKQRKAITGQRCEQIRMLSPDGIISWANAFPLSTWEGGAMPEDRFTVLIEHIEPDVPSCWPSVVREALGVYQEEDLPHDPAYQSFLQALDDKTSPQSRKRKRKRVSWDDEPAEAEGSSRVDERRASCFPDDPNQDVSFTFWCGANEGYRLNREFGLQRQDSNATGIIWEDIGMYEFT